jgi:hypothetical protein
MASPEDGGHQNATDFEAVAVGALEGVEVTFCVLSLYPK